MSENLKRRALTVIAFLASMMLTPLLVLGPFHLHDLMKIAVPFLAAPIMNALFFHTLGLGLKSAWLRGLVAGWAGVVVAWIFMLAFFTYYRAQ